MPINRCQLNNKPGWKWGSSGKCYTYDPSNKATETVARKKAQDQGIAAGEYFREVLDRLQKIYKKLKGK